MTDLEEIAYRKGREGRRAGMSLDAGNVYSARLMEAWQAWRRGWMHEDIHLAADQAIGEGVPSAVREH